MKKNIVSIVLAAAVVVLFVLYFVRPGQGNIGYVDTNVLMNKYQGMTDARMEFEKKAQTWQGASDTLITQFRADLQQYEKERAHMSAKEKQLKEELLRTKQAQVNKYRQATETKAKEEEQKVTQSILNTVNNYVTEYGKKHGYKYILGANGSGSLLYADKKEDLTQVILDGLNHEYKKK